MGLAEPDTWLDECHHARQVVQVEKAPQRVFYRFVSSFNTLELSHVIFYVHVKAEELHQPEFCWRCLVAQKSTYVMYAMVDT